MVLSLRGLFYRKLAEREKLVEELPGFKIDRPKRIVEIPKMEDITQINIMCPLIEPFAYAHIKWDPTIKELIYSLIEPELTKDEEELLNKISDALIELVEVGLTAIKGTAKAAEYLEEQVLKIIKDFGLRLEPNQYIKIMYHIYRNFVGYNEIEALMQDPHIEDISCDGINTPVFIVHRKFGSIRTNIVFTDVEKLRGLVVKFAERSGRYVSYAEPILDGTLPDGSRVSATIAEDIATRGATFTIRKFGEKPFSPIEQIDLNTASAEVLAYYWYLIENGGNLLIVGGTATGKTSFMNSICMFIPPEAKIVSIEDSVLPDSEILVEINKKINKTTIGELIDSLLKSGKQILNDGSEICKPKHVKIFSLDRDGNVKLSIPSAFIRHRVRKSILEVKTASGRKIKVTKDHSLFSLNQDGAIVPIVGSDLSVGNYIAIPRYIPINCKDYEVNLTKYFSLFKDCYLRGPDVTNILKKYAEDFEIKFSKKYQYWTRNGIIPVKYLPITTDSLDAVIYRGSSNALLLSFVVDEKIATLCGIWLADGSFDKNSIIFSDPNEECQQVVKEVAAKFGVNCTKHSDGVSLLVNSSVLKRIWKNILKLDGNAYTKVIPNWICGLPKEKVSAFLRGYFSGDGSVKSHEIEVRSCSLKLLYDIQTLLLRFGIVFRVNDKMLKDKTFTGKISGIEFLTKFRDEINFIQHYNRNKLERICNSSKDITPCTDIIPLSKDILLALSQELKAKLKEKGKKWKWGWHYISGNRRITRKNLKRKVNLINEGKLKKKLEMLSNNDVFWDKITQIKESVYDGYVYDISVPNLENFICNNVIAHNTRELRVPHEHWISCLARVGFGIPMPTGEKYGEVSMFDLLRESFRQNPDYVIVGETRGVEAYVMFQGMASGHTSISTFHAGSLDAVLKRLTSPPINLSPTLIESLNVVTIMAHAREKEKAARRIKEIVEIISVDPKTEEVKTNLVYTWNVANDTYEKVNDSMMVRRLAEAKGATMENAVQEIERRRKVLEWMHAQNIKDYLEVTRYINMYYKEPEKLFELMKEKIELPVKPKAVAKPEEKPARRTSILELLGFKFIREK